MNIFRDDYLGHLRTMRWVVTQISKMIQRSESLYTVLGFCAYSGKWWRVLPPFLAAQKKLVVLPILCTVWQPSVYFCVEPNVHTVGRSQSYQLLVSSDCILPFHPIQRLLLHWWSNTKCIEYDGSLVETLDLWDCRRLIRVRFYHVQAPVQGRDALLSDMQRRVGFRSSSR